MSAIFNVDGGSSSTDPQEETGERDEIIIQIVSASSTLDTKPQHPLHNEQYGLFQYEIDPAFSLSHHEDMSQVPAEGLLPYSSIHIDSAMTTPAMMIPSMDLPHAPPMDTTQAMGVFSHSVSAFPFEWMFHNSPDAVASVAFPHTSDLYLDHISSATTTTTASDTTVASQTQGPSPGNQLIIGSSTNSTASAAHIHDRPENPQYGNQASKNPSSKGSNGMSTAMKLQLKFMTPLTAASYEEKSASSPKAESSSQKPNRRPGRPRLPMMEVTMEDPVFLMPLIHSVPLDPNPSPQMLPQSSSLDVSRLPLTLQGPLAARKVIRTSPRREFYIQAPYIHSKVRKDGRVFNSTHELKKAQAEAAKRRNSEYRYT